LVEYQGTYTDKNGSEPITICNDGTTLRTVIRDIVFEGEMFDDFAPVGRDDSDISDRFPLKYGILESIIIEWKMPIPIWQGDQETESILHVRLEMGPWAEWNIEYQRLWLVLEYDNRRFTNSKPDAWFEYAMLDIQSQLPDDVYMKACINCLYSDYSPYGHGMFGCMACFRTCKEEYLQVKSKDDYWPVLEKCQRIVQETYLCDKFERRVPGTGYRG